MTGLMAYVGLLRIGQLKEGVKHLEAALDNMKAFVRIVLCGMISEYNATSPTPGPSNIFLAISKRLRLQGFIVRNH